MEKSRQYFKFLNIEETDKVIQARLGFYLFAIECISGVKDLEEIAKAVLDNEFNSKVYKKGNDDLGIDAVIFDNDTNQISLYIFKFNKDYNEQSRQGENPVALATKFLSSVRSQSSSGANGKTKEAIEDIIERFNSDSIWSLTLNYVSNDSKGFVQGKEPIINDLESTYGMSVCSYKLDDLSNFITLSPKPITAKLLIDNRAILTYEEHELSSEKSYLLRIPIYELVKITCNNQETRHEIDTRKILSIIKNSVLSHDVLFDNVRGYLGDTKYNKNMMLTLELEPNKFFVYNNGITATVNNIHAESVNGNTKWSFTLDNFQIVNGGQTLKTIYKVLETEYEEATFISAEVLLRIFSTKGKSELTNKIAEYTNSQNAISDTNLKSLNYIQLQIEQYLEMKDILYVRKVGEIGEKKKNYKYRISMEKLAQIIYSAMGFPDRASNQKKRLFNTYYSDIFEKNFDIEQSEKYIETYYNVIEFYKSSNIDHFDQKYFYVIYMVYKNISINFSTELIEKTLKEFKINDSISDSRKLLQVAFKEHLDKNIDAFIVAERTSIDS
jgi:hypothetical protein